MFDHNHCVPILRWKAGERRALRGLSPEDKKRLTPLVEWSRPGEVSPKEDRESPRPEPRELANDILKDWGAQPFFCDFRWFWIDTLNRNPAELRRYALELAVSGLRPIPVLTLGDREQYRNALRPLTDDASICVRLSYTDLVDPALVRTFHDFVSTTGHPPESIHVVADFAVNYRDLDLASVCRRLANLSRYETFTVAAGSFPPDLREFKGPQVLHLHRHEWAQYHNQIDGVLPRQPAFGDYATLHPILTKATGGLNPSASIRYTTDDGWLVMKGEGLHSKDGPRHEQYHGNAALLVRRREYRGSEFSAGDRYIHDVANRVDGPGNPTSWVQAGVNHHLAFVSRQVAEFFESAAAREEARFAPVRPSMVVGERRPPFHRGSTA